MEDKTELVSRMEHEAEMRVYTLIHNLALLFVVLMLGIFIGKFWVLLLLILWDNTYQKRKIS